MNFTESTNIIKTVLFPNGNGHDQPPRKKQLYLSSGALFGGGVARGDGGTSAGGSDGQFVLQRLVVHLIILLRSRKETIKLAETASKKKKNG